MQRLIALTFLCAAGAFGQSLTLSPSVHADALTPGKIVLPPIPKVYPDSPKAVLSSDVSPHISIRSTNPALNPKLSNPRVVERHESVPPPEHSVILYSRKKAGSAFVAVVVDCDSIVKLVDFATKSVHAELWVKKGEPLELPQVPASYYLVLFNQFTYRLPYNPTYQNNGYRNWYGKVRGLVEIPPDSRSLLRLGSTSANVPVVASTDKEFGSVKTPY